MTFKKHNKSKNISESNFWEATELKIDLHNHSSFSYDGKITYEEILTYTGVLDVIAITDHNNFGFHEKYMKIPGEPYSLGKLLIIPGEEILTSDGGEIIGLFLKKGIPKGLSFEKTIEHIKNQGGITLIPHPFDLYRVKSRPSIKKVIRNISSIDIIEVNNGKYFMFESFKAKKFALKYNKVISVGSDAHKINDLGKTYLISKELNKPIKTIDLVNILKSTNNEIKYHKKKVIYRIMKKIWNTLKVN